MEATSDYWKPPFYLLEAAGFETWLVNAKDVKHLPGRPKTDRLDGVWLCKVGERQMLRPSFVPPPEIRELRDLTRYRIDQVAVRNAEKQRVEKLLEDAQIKLSVVASNIFGVSGREMMAALIAGERDPKVLAQMARARLRAKLADLEEAFYGAGSTTTTPSCWARMLARVDAIDADLADLDARIEQQIARQLRGPAVTRLDAIPGVGLTIAQVIIAEVGLDMTRFPTAGHLVSWAKFAPTVTANQPARRRARTPPAMATPTSLVRSERPPSEPASTNTFLGERYRRLARRRGSKKALVAVGRCILVIVWHLLSDPTADFVDLGPDFHDRHVSTQRAIRSHVRHLEALGYRVTIHPAA